MRILGIDYGRRRLGLALSDETELLASPLPVRIRTDEKADHAFLCDLIRERGIGRAVVGLPLRMNGSHGEMANEALDFGATLAARCRIPVDTFDERLTTREAERVLVQADLPRARRRNLRDSVSAVLILQGYLEARRATPPNP
jgi:putative holliday junction resolvase